MRSPRTSAFIRQDILAILQALLTTTRHATGRGDEYNRGYLAAIIAVAIALSITRDELLDNLADFDDD